MSRRFSDLDRRRRELLLGGGAARIEKQHRQGKLTARERLALLLDPDSFVEFGLWAQEESGGGETLAAEGVVTGKGWVDGRAVYAFSQDFTVAGGSVGKLHAAKICECLRGALRTGLPVVGFNDSGGARIQEGVEALSGYGQIFYTNTLLSGVVPQISVIAGPCAGGAAYSPALTDFIVMAGDSCMFLTGPDVIQAVTGETVSAQDLGGADVHTGRSGVAQLSAGTEVAGLELAKLLLSYLPQNNNEDPPQIRPDDPPTRMDEALNSLIPSDENQPYDMRDAIEAIFDRDSFLEVQPHYAANAVVGFARMDGYSVGIVANQPAVMSGALNIDASDKIAKFIRTCDAFNVPLVTFVDCPGYLPGVDQEYGGVIRHGAKIIYAYCEATVPKISIVTRKAMGGAYVAMGSKQMRTDLAFAWPTAQIAVMGAEPAVRVLYRDDVKNAADPAARERELVAAYREEFFNPYRAADLGQIDEVIEPRETRPRLARALEILRTKVQQNPPKKHGLSPT